METQLQIKLCEVCHKADYFNLNTNFCSRCNIATHSNNIVNQVNNDVSEKTTIINGVKIEHLDKELKITAAWYNKKLVSFLSSCVLMVGIFWLFFAIPIGFFIANSLHSSIGNIKKIILELLTGGETVLMFKALTFIEFFLIYNLIAVYKNSTIVSIKNNTVAITHRPLLWRSHRYINISDIAQLYTVAGMVWMLGKRTSMSQREIDNDHSAIQFYNLFANLKEGKSIKLLSNLPSKEVGLLLEKQIEGYLGIIDQPIEGEVDKTITTQDT